MSRILKEPRAVIVSAVTVVLALTAWYFFADHPVPAHPNQVARFQGAMDHEPGLAYKTRMGPDDGLILTGTLEGRQFFVAVPKNWNGKGIVFANGYRMPGSSTDVVWKEIEQGSKSALRPLYLEGFAIGMSSYDKAGFGLESGIHNTLRLNDFIHRLGASPVYAFGVSMGGSVVLNMIQQRQRPFDGALAACGVVGSWQTDFGRLVDVRAAYEYFTRHTRYALPGVADIHSNMVNPSPPRILDFADALWGLMQLKRILHPVEALFRAAMKNPGGAEAKMVHSIAEAANVREDFSSFGWPLFTVGLGIEDMRESFGGSPFDNSQTIYHVASLSPAENEALNRGIQRIHADPSAIAYAKSWDATGRFDTPLVTLHNSEDALVAGGGSKSSGRAQWHSGPSAAEYRSAADTAGYEERSGGIDALRVPYGSDHGVVSRNGSPEREASAPCGTLAVLF